jgi:hypothetical protein
MSAAMAALLVLVPRSRKGYEKSGVMGCNYVSVIWFPLVLTWMFGRSKSATRITNRVNLLHHL